MEIKYERQSTLLSLLLVSVIRAMNHEQIYNHLQGSVIISVIMISVIIYAGAPIMVGPWGTEDQSFNICYTLGQDKDKTTYRYNTCDEACLQSVRVPF